MRKRNIYMKAMTMAVTTAMIAGVCPTSVFAVTGSQVAADDIYTKTAHVARTQEDDDNEDIWDEYDVEVSVTVADGVFSDITVSPTTGYSADNATYFNKAYTGRNGVKLKLEGKAATEDTVNTWDAVSGATRTSSAIKTAVLEAVNGAEEAAGEVTDPQIDTAALEAEIAKVPLLVEADYTADSWSNLQSKLQAANDALAAKESQEAVNAAATALSDAITGLTPVEDDNEEENISYILMNIPYDKFYAADVNNSVGVDAFTSATLNKTRTGSLSGGSYHVNSDGTDITGITFPVKVSEGADLTGYTRITDENSVDIEVTNRGTTTTTTYQGKDALYESASYSYYVLSEAPSYYKEMIVGADGSLSFGAVQGTKTTLSDVTADLVTTTTYGDYQLSLDGLPIGGNDPIYGVIIGTKEGASYGLRHLENIWLGSELAWSTGFTTAVHNCPTSSEHYKAMMGQTINKITYYTKDGIYEIPADVYVPVKFSSEVKVEDAALVDGETAITLTGIPSDFDAEYTAAGLNNVEVKDGKLSFEGTNVGSYTLNITDKSGKYAPISATFELTTDKVPVEYDEENKTLAVKDGFAESDLGAYVKNIQKVSVNGKEYAASGRGAVKIIDADGSLLTDAAPFAEAKSGDEFDIVVFATGYSVDYSFTYKIADEIKEDGSEDDKKDPADSGEKKDGKWVQDSHGYKYQNADGTYVVGKWQDIDGKRYYFGTDGYRKTGWQKLGSTWYYMNHAGVMTTGWQLVSGKWYYMNGSGVMTTGWQQVDGKWYYMNGSGAMTTGWQLVSGKWYYMNSSGAMLSDWQLIGGKWYYMNGSGAMTTGWQLVRGKWYYMNGSGAMTTGWQKVSNKWYYMDQSGAMMTGWQLSGGKWYYMNGSGAMTTGWQKVNDKWYYMYNNGAMAASTWVGRYYVNQSGAWTKSR